MSNNIRKDQIISISGATATGKTTLALAIGDHLLNSKKFSKVHLLSADSRQVYKGLEILTGADIPKSWSLEKNSKLDFPFYKNPKGNIFLHGTNIIKIDDDWSVAQFKKLFENLKKYLKSNEILIVVGGSGFYHRQTFNAAETLEIKPDWKLREKLEKKTVSELQKILKNLDSKKLKSMNNSDINNPRRLIRAIEVAKSKSKINLTEKNINNLNIYLELEKKKIADKIVKRVELRFKKALLEIKKLEKENIDWNLIALSSTGAKYLEEYLQGKISKEDCLQLWNNQEFQYAKRQITWWKKEKQKISIKADDKKLLEKALKIIQDLID